MDLVRRGFSINVTRGRRDLLLGGVSQCYLRAEGSLVRRGFSINITRGRRDLLLGGVSQ